MRCDEEKPACNRCVSTGRKCDGYEAPPAESVAPATQSSSVLAVRSSFSPSQSPPEASSSSHLSITRQRHNYVLPPQATADVKLALPRTDPEELRSYRYFIEVTAPVIAGSFDGKFWLTDIPRVCLSDPAIWHAVVSLGSVHERYSISAGNSSLARNIFALRQFNSSIRCLTEPTSPRRADRMRAVTVSAIFTCLCALDGQYSQARMHARSGVQLLKEIDDEQREKRSLNTLKRLMMGPEKAHDLSRVDWDENTDGNSSDEAATYSRSPWQVPISPAAVRSIIQSYEVAEKAFDSGGFDTIMPLLTNNERFGIWSTYKLPSTLANGQSPLTFANLTLANRAAESLVHGLSKWAHESGGGLEELTANPSVELMFRLLSTQAPYVKCMRVLKRAVRIFEREIEAGQGIAKGASESTMLILERSMLAFRCYLSVINFALIGDPDSNDAVARYRSLPDICAQIVESAQHIIDIESKLKADGVSMPAIPGLATPLFIVAFSGFSWPIRRRALSLLRVPRLDGLWDSLMGASMAEAAINREREAASVAEALGHHVTMPYAKLGDTEQEIATMYRIYKIYADFTGKREMKLRLRTWGEVIRGEYGWEGMVYW